jgi:hypothetical protein
MTQLEIVDEIGRISSESEKVKFLVSELIGFFNRALCKDDDSNMLKYEAQRIFPLVMMMDDYSILLDDKINNLYDAIDKARA